MSTEWNNDLPPSGTQCEYTGEATGDYYDKCTYIGRASGEDFVLLDDGTIDRMKAIPGRFRPIKAGAEKRRDEQIEKLALYLQDYLDGNHDAAAKELHGQGCRMTRELTPEVIEKIIEKFVPQGANFEAMELAAAYVRGELEI